MSLKKASLVGLLAAAVLAIPASAATVEELQAQVNALLAQLAAMQGGGSSAGCYGFTVDLTEGSTGADVTALQSFLESKGYFTYAGAKGYFGAITKAAVAAWQSANGVAPAVGYFGPISRAKYNSMCGSMSDDDSDDSDSDSDNDLEGGEASLEDFNAKSGDDSEVEEGSDGEVAVFEFDVEDGDCEVQRVDVTLTRSSGTEDGDETFQGATLWFDGDMVGEVENLDDEDEWLSGGDGSTGVVRFSGLDALVNEGDSAEFSFMIEAQDGIDNLPETWTAEIDTDDIRCLDGEGIDQYTGDTSDTVSFDVVTAGQDDELSLSEADDNPEAMVLEVDDSANTEHTVAVMQLRADDLPVQLSNFIFRVGVATDTTFNEVVNDLHIVLDGVEYDDWSATGGTTATGTVTIDLSDDDPIVDGTVELEIVLDIKGQVSGTTYDEGTLVFVDVPAATWDTVNAEGEKSGNDLDGSQLKGSFEGEYHTLRQEGIVTTLGDVEADLVGAQEAVAEYSIEVDIEAFGADFYIEKSAARDVDGDGSDGIEFFLQDDGGTEYSTTTVTVSSSLSASGSNSGDNATYWKIPEGSTRTFTLLVTLDNDGATDPVAADYYRVQLSGISFDSDGSGATADDFLTSGLDDYETGLVFVDTDNTQ